MKMTDEEEDEEEEDDEEDETIVESTTFNEVGNRLEIILWVNFWLEDQM